MGRTNKLLRLGYGAYKELKYVKELLGNRRNNSSQMYYVENSRDIIESFSPKPIGKYTMQNGRKVDDMIDLSIIVPVYNSQKYLKECVESIINQKTTYVYEIICVNDGSTDDSFYILEKIQREYGSKIIKIINQSNRGFSGARNRGLDEACGKYVMFVDSDDVVEPLIVQHLMNTAKETGYDIVSCGYYSFGSQGRKLILDKAIIQSGDVSRVMLRYHPFFWGKIYKRTVWNDIRLPEGYWFEDMIMYHLIARLVNGFAYLSEPLYGYRKNTQGISATCSNKVKSVDQLWMVEYISEEYDLRNLEKDFWFYKNILKELGLYLYVRTSNLPEHIRHSVFSFACDMTALWHIENMPNLGISEERLLKSFREKNFLMWERVCRCWH